MNKGVSNIERTDKFDIVFTGFDSVGSVCLYAYRRLIH